MASSRSCTGAAGKYIPHSGKGMRNDPREAPPAPTISESFLFLQKVEVPMMLRLLREQRMFMIQTIAQYKFVYQVLIQFLQNSRLI